MPIIKIKTVIDNKEIKKEEETKGIILDDILKYQEEDKTKVSFNYKKNELIRENNKIKMKYIFSKNKETKGKIYIKDIKKYIDIPIETKKITKNKYSIYIEYKIENNNYYYRIEEII